MPKEQHDIRQFLRQLRSPHAKHLIIKRNKGGHIKFKLRLRECLWTLVVDNRNDAKKLSETIPESLKVIRVNRRR